MDLELSYTNHLGETLSLGSGNLHYMKTDAFDHSWEWEESAGEIMGLRLSARTLSLPMGMFGGSLDERERSFRILEADVVAGELGTLSFHGYDLTCMPVSTALDMWWFDDGIEERAVTLVAPRPFWSRDVLTPFPIAERGSSEEWLCLPCDLPIDLGAPAPARVIDVDTVGPAEWRWVVHGPATNPYVTIAGNRYEVDATVPDGSTLVLDTRDRTVMIVAPDGSAVNAFSSRKRGIEGSGSYAMARIPRGTHQVFSSGAFAFDVVVHDERTEPAWV